MKQHLVRLMRPVAVAALLALSGCVAYPAGYGYYGGGGGGYYGGRGGYYAPTPTVVVPVYPGYGYRGGYGGGYGGGYRGGYYGR